MESVKDFTENEQITKIKFDYLENKYIDDCGNSYATLQDIPLELHHTIRPIKPIKPLHLRVKGVLVKKYINN